MARDPLIINRDDVVQWTQCILSHGGFLLLTWLRLATFSSTRFGGRQPYIAKHPYVIAVGAFPDGQSALNLASARLIVLYGERSFW
jgi:hypothetical protein